jgi:hypothetical protein
LDNYVQPKIRKEAFMNTPSSRVLWTSTLAALVFVALAACSAHAAAFQNLGPNSGWQYDAPAGVTIGNISDPDANNTVFTLSRTWTGLEPVTITFKVAANNQNEHFFWMNLDLTVGNAAWSGFDITTIRSKEMLFTRYGRIFIQAR